MLWSLITAYCQRTALSFWPGHNCHAAESSKHLWRKLYIYAINYIVVGESRYISLLYPFPFTTFPPYFPCLSEASFALTTIRQTEARFFQSKAWSRFAWPGWTYPFSRPGIIIRSFVSYSYFLLCKNDLLILFSGKDSYSYTQ